MIGVWGCPAQPLGHNGQRTRADFHHPEASKWRKGEFAEGSVQSFWFRSPRKSKYVPWTLLGVDQLTPKP